MSDVHPLSLTEDVAMPLVGFGTYLIDEEEVEEVVTEALAAGYRHVDTAEAYGNEAGVGRALARAFDGGLARSEVFLTTKLWPGNAAWGQTPKDRTSTVAALEASLERLGLDAVDLYLIHAPFDPAQRLAQSRGLLDARERGLARAVGVSNFAIRHLEELREAGLPLPAANQVELHPWSQKPELRAWMADHGVHPIAYSSLVPLSTWRAAEGQASAKTEAMTEAGQRVDSPFKAMARRHGVTEAQVLLRWAVQQRIPVLPKSTKPERIRQNLDLFSFALSGAEMNAIAGMDRGDGVAWSSGDPTHAA